MKPRPSAGATPSLLDKFKATFESYWNSPECESYDPDRDRDRLDDALLEGGVELLEGGLVDFGRSLADHADERALAADAEHLLPVIAAARRRDVFADPFTDPDADLGDPAAADRRPILVILDDGSADASVREQRGRLVTAAQERDIRVETVATDAPSEVARYAALLATGTFAAAYLGVGLNRLNGGPTG